MSYWHLLVMVLFFAACKREQPVEIVKYKDSDFASSPLPNISTVPLPIYFGFDEIDALIKEKLPVVLINTPAVKKGSLKGAALRIVRKNDIKLREKNDQLFVNLKLKVDIKPKITKHVMGREVTVSPKVEAVVDIDLQTPIDLDADYRPITNFRITRLDYIEEPEAHLIFMRLPVRNAVDSILNEHSGTIEATINELIKDYVKLQKPIERIWSKLHRPIRINKKISEVYIQATPVGIGFSSITISSDGIWVQTRLSAYVETRIGNDTLPRSVTELPKLKKYDSIDNSFDMRFRVIIPLAQVNEILNEHYASKPLETEYSTVTIKHLSLQTTPKGLLLIAEIVEPTSANLFFRSGLRFHAPDTALVASDVSFEVNQGGLLVSAADAILHETVMEAIGKELQIPLGKLLNQLEPLVEQAIHKGKIGKTLSVDLSDVVLNPNEIGYRPDSIVVEVQATGQAALQILQFKKQEPKAL